MLSYSNLWPLCRCVPLAYWLAGMPLPVSGIRRPMPVCDGCSVVKSGYVLLFIRTWHVKFDISGFLKRERETSKIPK